MLTRCPAVLPPGIASLATQAVLNAEIEAGDAAVLRNASTVLVVVEASLMTIDRESMTAPSLLLQSTRRTHPAPVGVLKLVAVVSAAVSPIVAKECSGRSTSRGCLLLELVANDHSRPAACIPDRPLSLTMSSTQALAHCVAGHRQEPRMLTYPSVEQDSAVELDRSEPASRRH